MLLYQLSGECIAYRNSSEDTSVLLQIWGFLYDATFDANEVDRSQGMWGATGWFIAWLNNRLVSAVTYHKGVGPAGVPGEDTPELGVPYGFVGFVMGSIAGGIFALILWVIGIPIRLFLRRTLTSGQTMADSQREKSKGENQKGHRGLRHVFLRLHFLRIANTIRGGWTN